MTVSGSNLLLPMQSMRTEIESAYNVRGLISSPNFYDDRGYEQCNQLNFYDGMSCNRRENQSWACPWQFSALMGLLVGASWNSPMAKSIKSAPNHRFPFHFPIEILLYRRWDRLTLVSRSSLGILVGRGGSLSIR